MPEELTNEEQEAVFDKYLKNKVDKNTGEVIGDIPTPRQVADPQPQTAVATKQESSVAPQRKGSFAERFLNQVVAYAETSGSKIDSKTKALAVDIITATNKVVLGGQYNWSEIDIQGSNLISQIKRWSSLGVTMEDHLFVDIRNNGKTGLKDITIKPQYQTVEKLIRLYYSLPVVRFKTEIVCVGDEVVEEEDFETGLSKIVKHTRNNDIDRNCLDNIIGAYKILYFKDGNSINQYVVRIDKNRITRAMNASSSREKTVWKLDSVKMTKKTVTWEMWNDSNVRAFMNFPEELQGDLSVMEETSDMDWGAETKHKSVNHAQEDVQVNAGMGEEIKMHYEEV